MKLNEQDNGNEQYKFLLQGITVVKGNMLPCTLNYKVTYKVQTKIY